MPRLLLEYWIKHNLYVSKGIRWPFASHFKWPYLSLGLIEAKIWNYRLLANFLFLSKLFWLHRSIRHSRNQLTMPLRSRGGQQIRHVNMSIFAPPPLCESREKKKGMEILLEDKNLKGDWPHLPRQILWTANGQINVKQLSKESLDRQTDTPTNGRYQFYYLMKSVILYMKDTRTDKLGAYHIISNKTPPGIKQFLRGRGSIVSPNMQRTLE